MKKIFYIFIGVIALIACTKETDVATSVSADEAGAFSFNVYLEDATKATINSSDGVFSWTGDEEIAVWDSKNKEFVTFSIASYSNEGYKQARFTTSSAKADAVFVGNVAYYPASIATRAGSSPEDYSPTYTFPTSFANLTDASKGFPMSGTVTVNEIKLSHLGSMIDVTLKNVPSFTTKLILNAGSTTINVTAAPTDGSLHAVVPIPAGTYVLTINLQDDVTPTANTFYSKARSSKTYTASNYYPINDITLGRLLTFTNDAGWASPKVHIWQHDNTGNNTDITTDSAYPQKLFLRATKVYYVLLDSDVKSWTSDGNAIGVQFVSTTNGSNTTQTNCVYLYRNIDFTIPAGGGMKTNYRVYYTSSYGSSTHAFVWSDIAIYVRWDNWGVSDRKANFWIDGYGSGFVLAPSSRIDATTGWTYSCWPLKDDGGRYWAKYKTLLAGLQIGTGDDNYAPGDKSFDGYCRLYYKYDGSHSGGEVVRTEISTDETISASWPGDAATQVSGTLYCYTFDSSCYGKAWNIIFNNNNNGSQSADYHALMDREYKL